MHLIRPIDNPHGPPTRIHGRQRRILTDTRPTIRLDRTINHLQQHARHLHLDLSDLLERGLCIALVDLDRRVQHRETGSVDFNARFCDSLKHDSVGAQELAEGFLSGVLDAGEEPLEGLLGGADGAHGVMDSAGAQTALDDFEAASFAEDHVGGRDAYVVEEEVAVAVGGVVEAADGEHAFDGDAGRVGGDEDDGLLFVFVGVCWVGFGHDDVDFAAHVAGAGGPPFLEGDC